MIDEHAVVKKYNKFNGNYVSLSKNLRLSFLSIFIEVSLDKHSNLFKNDWNLKTHMFTN